MHRIAHFEITKPQRSYSPIVTHTSSNVIDGLVKLGIVVAVDFKSQVSLHGTDVFRAQDRDSQRHDRVRGLSVCARCSVDCCATTSEIVPFSLFAQYSLPYTSGILVCRSLEELIGYPFRIQGRDPFHGAGHSWSRPLLKQHTTTRSAASTLVRTPAMTLESYVDVSQTGNVDLHSI